MDRDMAHPHQNPIPPVAPQDSQRGRRANADSDRKMLTDGGLSKGRRRPAQRHDCGDGKRMTVAQIAKEARTSINTIYRRLALGVRGAALLATDSRGRGRAAKKRSMTQWKDRAAHTGGVPTVYIAARIAIRWKGRAPTADELIQEFGMSRACAYRWRASFVDAYGELSMSGEARAQG